MRRYKQERYIGVDASSAVELAEKLTAIREDLKGSESELLKITDDLRSALFVVIDHFEEPETLAEKYEMEGKGMTCGDCRHKTPVFDGRKKWQYTCMRRRPGTNATEPACNWFYMDMEENEA